MATGKKIERRGHIVGFKDEISKASEIGKDAFFTWFDQEESADHTFVRGSWDFMVHIAMPLSRYLKEPENKTILEIGCGGGRILAAAARSFRHAIGIDIHDRLSLVKSELDARGATNTSLLQTDGLTIPVGPGEIDAAFSFIVLQHVEKIGIFENYVKETYRVLRPGGLAILYFGRPTKTSMGTSSIELYGDDCAKETSATDGLGFMEIPAKVNQTNLVIASRYAKEVASSAGLEVLDQVVSHKHVPDGIMLYGGQHGLVLRRPGH